MHRRLFLKLAATAAGLFSLFGLSRLALPDFRNRKPKTIADNTAWIQKKIDHQALRGGGLVKINCDDLANNFGCLSADGLSVHGGVSLVFFNTRGRQWMPRGWLIDGSKHKNRNLAALGFSACDIQDASEAIVTFM